MTNIFLDESSMNKFLSELEHYASEIEKAADIAEQNVQEQYGPDNVPDLASWNPNTDSALDNVRSTAQEKVKELHADATSIKAEMSQLREIVQDTYRKLKENDSSSAATESAIEAPTS